MGSWWLKNLKVKLKNHESHSIFSVFVDTLSEIFKQDIKDEAMNKKYKMTKGQK